ncbi:hypothetical protein C1645_839986 [Glomus cerebriforme]|uniref:Uncharacterized protein n=1 Tax=Glomus cerebriforme TaxID=658196 RepID=A0A397S5Z6_9GLOM|nr:hypothetical protein C1645_839986 [Glomus cerebriforme]
MSGIGSELAKVAIRIHGICENLASVERLWSNKSDEMDGHFVNGSDYGFALDEVG